MHPSQNHPLCRDFPDLGDPHRNPKTPLRLLVMKVSGSNPLVGFLQDAGGSLTGAHLAVSIGGRVASISRPGVPPARASRASQKEKSVALAEVLLSSA